MKKNIVTIIGMLFLSTVYGCSGILYSVSTDKEKLRYFTKDELDNQIVSSARTWAFTSNDYNKNNPCKADRSRNFPKIFENKDGKLFMMTFPENEYNRNGERRVYGVSHAYKDYLSKYEKCDKNTCQKEIKLHKCKNKLLCGKSSDRNIIVRMNDCNNTDYYVEYVNYGNNLPESILQEEMARSKKIQKNTTTLDPVAVIGAAAIVGYGLYKLFGGGDDSNSKKYSSGTSSVGSDIYKYKCSFSCRGASIWHEKERQQTATVSARTSSEAAEIIKDKYKEFCHDNFGYHSGQKRGAHVSYPSCSVRY